MFQRRFKYGRSCVAGAIIVGLAILPQTTSAQAPDLNDPERRAIEEMFAAYNDALVRRDYTALRDYLEVPFIVLDATTRVAADLDALTAGLQRLREAMDSQSYATSTPGPSRFLVLSAARVLMSRSVRHYRKDGGVIDQRANVYVLRRSAGRWRIEGTIQQEPTYVPSLAEGAPRAKSPRPCLEGRCGPKPDGCGFDETGTSDRLESY